MRVVEVFVARQAAVHRLSQCDRATGTVVPGTSETEFVESGHLSLLIVLRLELGWRDVPDRSQQSPQVEPIHPDQRGKLHRLKRAPRPLASNHLRLEEPDHRLG